MNRVRRRLALLALTLVLAVAASGVGMISASAATVPTITCHLSLDYPHESTHVPGTINVVSTETCTAPVISIVMSVELVRDGVYVQPAGSCSAEGRASLQCNTAEACHSGSYYGAWTQAEVVFPPGYEVSPGESVTFQTEQQIFCTELDENETLTPGEALHSPDGDYSLQMQSSDGNLVEYGPNGAMWASCTNYWPGSVATMQGDGNFVVYSPGHIARYATGTHWPGSVLQLQNDGNIVIYAPGHVAIWASAQHRVC